MAGELKTDALQGAGAPQEGANGVGNEVTRKDGTTPQEGAQGAKNGGSETPRAAKGTYTHKFARMVDYEGKQYKTLTFYWENLTGHDMISIENEMQAMNEYAIAPEMSASFLCRMAARAGGVGPDFLEALPIGEFSKIKNEARSFLIGMGF